MSQGANISREVDEGGMAVPEPGSPLFPKTGTGLAPNGARHMRT